MDLVEQTQLVVPAGTEGATPIVIDLGKILASERRQDEIAYVTKQKAPELLAEFNRSWRDLHRLVATLTAEHVKAQKAVANRRAVVLLEVVPARLKELGLSSTVDTRDAVIELDPKRRELQDVSDQLEAAVEHFKGKMKAFENAFTSVKKIMGEDGYAGRGPNSNLSGGADAPQAAPQVAVTLSRTVPPPSSSPRPGFGKPRYG